MNDDNDRPPVWLMVLVLAVVVAGGIWQCSYCYSAAGAHDVRCAGAFTGGAR